VVEFLNRREKLVHVHVRNVPLVAHIARFFALAKDYKIC
jgi:hypothetical protein